MKKKVISIILATSLAVMTMTACGSSTETSENTATEDSAAETDNAAIDSETAADTTTSDTEAQKVVFWYNHTGDEADVYEEAIAAYNASQSNYVVEGLSVTDNQKIIVAMSSNEAPDVLDLSNQTIIQYAQSGLLEPMSDFISAEGYDTSIFSEQAIAANTIDGVIYGLPFQAYTIQMYYNKDLLTAAGYDNPPTTMEEMYEMAVAATTLDADGNIDILGYPLFPYASARQELIYGFGGRWWDEDGNMTPTNQGNLDSLNMNVKFREQFGGKALDAFIGTANTNRYTEQDMFFQGKQLFRLDGSWLPTMMENFGSTVNWGITLVPGTEANPELQGTSRYETTGAAIPAMAENKEGAWDFCKFLASAEGAKIIDLGTGNLPALELLYDDADFNAVPGFTEFMDALKQEKGIQYPIMKNYDEYMNLVNSALDTVYAGSATPEEAMNDLAAQAANLE